jgi:hypothetical protein
MLRLDYGFSQAYTPDQIRATIERNGLNRDHLAYAVAMFSNPAGFAQFHEKAADQYRFDALRDELAAYYVDANANFDGSYMTHGLTDTGWHGGADGHDGNGDGSY